MVDVTLGGGLKGSTIHIYSHCCTRIGRGKGKGKGEGGRGNEHIATLLVLVHVAEAAAGLFTIVTISILVKI